MITYIPASEWHSSDQQKPADGVDVLGVIGKGKNAYVDIVVYDSEDGTWTRGNIFHLKEVKVAFWTELPNVPYEDTSRKS